MVVSRNCASGSEACCKSVNLVDRCCGRVDRLAGVVFPSYLFRTVTSGEIGLSAGAEGATAPETLRQTDPRDFDNIWKETPKGFGPERPPTG
jgi:hypothetical protein